MKQDLYENLTKRKNEGEILNWNLITKKELEELFRNHSDNTIAELYGVTAYQVKKQRNKWNIKQYNYAIQESLQEFLSEDKNKTLEKNGAKNLSILKRIALNIIKIVQCFYNISLKLIRYKISMNT